MAKDSRERMVVSAAALIGSHGANATSFSDVLEASRTPRGSIYHHFPEGKGQLVQEAVRWTTRQVLAYQRSSTATSPSGVLQHFVRLFRQSVLTSHCRAGCPVAGVAIDAYADEEELIRVVRGSFRSWIELLTRQLESTGIPYRSARSLGITALASVEGALILCRAEGSVDPLDVVAEQLGRLVRRPASRRPPSRTTR